jgi:hypothetical protein
MNVAEARIALAAACEAAGYRSYDTLPDDVELPAVAVGWPDEVTYHLSAAGKAGMTITVKFAVSTTDQKAAQRAIDAFMSWPGVAKQIEDHATDAWRSIQVRSTSGVRPVTFGNRAALMVDMNVEIFK